MLLIVGRSGFQGHIHIHRFAVADDLKGYLLPNGGVNEQIGE